ncbi:unnamed protein product [marine sediment metagenome]|uniref:Uncharacterized protein n=1 Tax=marine sediment metagenome TaxID=412755 RepID=X1ASH7_9ZZZZ
MNKFNEHENDNETMELVFLVGRETFFNIYDCEWWNDHASREQEEFLNLAMQIYYDVCQSVQKSILFFMCYCRFELGLDKNVAKIILVDVWNSRQEIGKYGWYKKSNRDTKTKRLKR